MRDRFARLAANVFAVPFGVVGLARLWREAAQTGLAPEGPALGLHVLAAVLWVGIAAVWLVRAAADPARAGRELADPVADPFLVLAPLTATLLGAELSRHAPGPGVALTLVGAALVVLHGAMFLGHWLVTPLPAVVHGGHLLPTVAGGLVCAAATAEIGHRSLAGALFGLGVVGWLTVGTVVLARLAGGPVLPAPVRPTLAIMMAPPVVAGGAWSEIGRLDDMVGLGLAGASVLIVLAQVRLLPVYRALSFSAGFWSFTFSSAAAASFGLRWLAQAAPPGHRELGQLLVAAVTVLIGAIAVRSVRALRDGTYLPTAPAGVPLSVPPADPPAVPVSAPVPAPVPTTVPADGAAGSSAGVPRAAVRGDDGSGA